MRSGVHYFQFKMDHIGDQLQLVSASVQAQVYNCKRKGSTWPGLMSSTPLGSFCVLFGSCSGQARTPSNHHALLQDRPEAKPSCCNMILRMKKKREENILNTF
jgi:hypothetical protein